MHHVSRVVLEDMSAARLRQTLLSCGMLLVQHPTPHSHRLALQGLVAAPSPTGNANQPVVVAARPWEYLGIVSSISSASDGCVAGVVLSAEANEEAAAAGNWFRWGLPRGAEGRCVVAVVSSLGVALARALREGRSPLFREQLHLVVPGGGRGKIRRSPTFPIP